MRGTLKSSTIAKSLGGTKDIAMARLRNPHPGEILKEELLERDRHEPESGNSMPSACRAIASTPSSIGTRAIGAILICAYANFSACPKVIFCDSGTPMIRWKPSAALRSRWPRPSRTSREKRPRPMKAITPASHFDEGGRGFRENAAGRPVWTLFWPIVGLSKSKDRTDIRSGGGTCNAFPCCACVPPQPSTQNRGRVAG